MMKNLMLLALLFLVGFNLLAAENSPVADGVLANTSKASEKLLTSGKLNVAKKTDRSLKTSSISSPHDLLFSFRPASQSKAVHNNKSKSALTVKQNGKVSIQRRTEATKDRSEQLKEQSLIKNKKFRNIKPQAANQADDFVFFSASSFLDADLDGDGFYSDFTIAFDADVGRPQANVFAIFYYRKNGGPWIEFYETDVLTLSSDSSDDEFLLSSTLNQDFPTNEYDFLIDLFEDGVEGIVATISSDNNSALLALPLEDLEHELNNNAVQITFVATDLSGDFDGDGFYTDLTLEYDIETPYNGDTLYAEIVVTNLTQGWQQFLSSDDFTIGNQTEFVDLTFNSGYPADLYDVQINLINRFTDEIIASAGEEFDSLEALPIESINNDDFFNNVEPAVEVHAGGGSFGWFLILIAFLSLKGRKGGHVPT